jgi:hypothetical protein
MGVTSIASQGGITDIWEHARLLAPELACLTCQGLHPTKCAATQYDDAV